MYDEYRRKKTPRWPITEKLNLEVFDHQIHQKISNGRHWRVVRRAIYEDFGYGHRSSVRSVIPELRAWAGAQRKTAKLLPLPLSREGFELPRAHGLDPMTMKLFVYLRGT